MVAAWIFAVSAFAQEPPQEETPIFRAETTLALLRFHVVQQNRYVVDLKPDDVSLFEDNKPLKITLFEGGASTRRTVPIELSLVFDFSGSVTYQGLLDPLVYKTSLLDGLPGVKLAVYGFNSRLFRFSRPTRDVNELGTVLNRVRDFKTGSQPRPDNIRIQLPPKRKSAQGGTWLYEAIIGAVKDAAATPGNATRMLLVFSDGFPTTDSHVGDAAPVATELGIPVYPVVLGHKRIEERIKQVQETAYDKRGMLKEAARDRLARIKSQEEEIQEFARIGELTGGRSFDPFEINLQAVRTILAGMVAQVRCEYVVGFTPEPSAGEPRKHKVQVKLRSKELGKLLGGTRTVLH